MKKILLLVFMVLAVTVAYSATRTGWVGGPADQGYLQFSDNGTNIITFSRNGVTISNATIAGLTVAVTRGPGTNEMSVLTCPGPTGTNTPIWIEVASTNGSSYLIPAVLKP